MWWLSTQSIFTQEDSYFQNYLTTTFEDSQELYHSTLRSDQIKAYRCLKKQTKYHTATPSIRSSTLIRRTPPGVDRKGCQETVRYNTRDDYTDADDRSAVLPYHFSRRISEEIKSIHPCLYALPSSMKEITGKRTGKLYSISMTLTNTMPQVSNYMIYHIPCRPFVSQSQR